MEQCYNDGLLPHQTSQEESLRGLLPSRIAEGTQSASIIVQGRAKNQRAPLARTLESFFFKLEGVTLMHRVFGLAKGIVRESFQRDRSSERYVEAVSRLLWPWRESWLLALLGFLALLDYVSTCTVSELSGKMYVHEGGPLSSPALQMGGAEGLFLINMAAASGLLLAALTIRFLYSRFGFRGFGRAAFVAVLAPYAVATTAAVFKNMVLAFL